MTPKELEALRESLAQKKRKGKASSSTSKRVKLTKPELTDVPPELTPVVVEDAPKPVIILPWHALPLTIPISQLFPSNALGVPKRPHLVSGPRSMVGETYFLKIGRMSKKLLRVP